jgi:4-amino-4-deoxy-L-arabinose transferase-like glycosyltransferase
LELVFRGLASNRAEPYARAAAPVLRVNPLLARRTERLLPALLGLAYALVAGLTMFLRSAYEIDPDEGFNLMKVLLVERGYGLYREIWSDQPPLFTYLGVVFVWLFGEHAESVRLVTVLLASALVFALADLLRREFSGKAALVAAVATAFMLPLGGRFASYSMAAMIGLPAIAWAVLSLYALLLARSRPLLLARSRPLLLALAGAAFAASLGTKGFTLFLAPVFAVVIGWQTQRRHTGTQAARFWQIVQDGCVFGLGLAAGLALWLGPIVLAGELSQLYASHGGTKSFGAPSFRQLRAFMWEDAWVYAVGLLGFGVALARRSLLGIALGAWALLSLLVLSSHVPLWRHHCLLIAVPAAGLGGLLAGTLAELSLKRFPTAHPLLRLAPVVGLLGVVFSFDVLAFAPRRASPKRQARYDQQQAVEAVVRERAPNARSMVTSRQIYAFRLGLEVPPELAVTSSKRFRSGQLSANRVSALIEKRRPDVVIIDRRWAQPIRDAIARRLARDYELIFSAEKAFDARVYLRTERDRRPPARPARPL